MHDNKRTGGFRNFLREKGYYVAALACALAVGAAGILYFSRDAQPEVLTASTAVPQLVEEPADDDSTPPAQRNAAPGVDAAKVLPDKKMSEEKPEAEPTAFTMIMPVEGDLCRLYSMDCLSFDPTTRDWRTHDGIDICSGVGAEVRAAADGTVASVVDDEALGTVVTISHAGGYTTRYANLDPAAKVCAGDRVAQGDAIGTVGTSALMEAGADDHLHFELCKNAVSLDPTDYFAW